MDRDSESWSIAMLIALLLDGYDAPAHDVRRILMRGLSHPTTTCFVEVYP